MINPENLILSKTNYQENRDLIISSLNRDKIKLMIDKIIKNLSAITLKYGVTHLLIGM
jgi:hypothetical protein